MRPIGVSRLTLPRLAALVLYGLAAGACAPEAQTEYSADTSTNFFAACSDPVGDDLLQRRICQCVYQRMEIELPYNRLVALDEELVTDPELKLAPTLVNFVAECVIQEADLDG